MGLLRISESVRTYMYLILSSQASARSNIIENKASALTVQKAFLNNFKDVVNRGVDIREDIKRYQDTLSYTSSKVDHSVGENIYMLPGDIKLNNRSETAGYKNKILISDRKFSLGKNDKVNTLEPAKEDSKISHKVALQPSLIKTQHRNKLSPMKTKSCLDTFSGRRFCIMVCVSIKDKTCIRALH